MTDITYIQGNSFSLSVPLLKRVVAKEDDTTTITTEPFIPASGDAVTVKLIGERRQYTYTPTMSDNVAVVELSGNELSGRYAIEVTILTANGERMRYAQPMALALVPYTGTVDSIVVGSATLDASIFFAMRGPKGEKGDKGDDGNGIANIAKTSTSGLVDTYTITYTNGATSTFEVTNGKDGAQGTQGVGVRSITQTSTSTESEGVNVITCILTDGSTSTFEVRNGAKGEQGESGQVPLFTVNNGEAQAHTLEPNTFYIFANPINSLRVTLGATVSGIANIYAFRFTAGQDNPTITLPQGVVINQDLSLKTGDVCEFSIQDNLALFSVWEAS